MNIKNKIYLPLEDKETLSVSYVEYNKEAFMRTLNKISVDLGASCKRYINGERVIVSGRDRKYVV